jgi:hypothetical protein
MLGHRAARIQVFRMGKCCGGHIVNTVWTRERAEELCVKALEHRAKKTPGINTPANLTRITDAFMGPAEKPIERIENTTAEILAIEREGAGEK